MYISFSTCDEEGQYQNPSALEVKMFYFHGFTNGGLIFDLTHMDGEKERWILEGSSRPFSPMKVGRRENIQSFTIVEYPASNPLTKAEFRERFGIGRLLNAAGHFA